MNRIKVGLLVLMVLALNLDVRAETKAEPLIVHEWGTFTSLQDESGKAIGGINTDDEPVPRFVHRLAHFLLLHPTEIPPIFFQGAPRCHPDVTMRLETPVIYFHPAPPARTIENLNVSASFRGGWLSEFYPDAQAQAIGLEKGSMTFGPLRADTTSSLTWSNLTIGGDWAGPETTAHVWTAPRAVDAANVRTENGEAEKYLFYRGVAHIEAPIAVVQNTASAEVTLRSQWPAQVTDRPSQLKSLWLVDIKPDQKIAFRTLPSLSLDPANPGVTASSQFSAKEYSEKNMAKLRASLQEALVAEGLFTDEALALLNTWELSYFKSAGTRVFFMVPSSWTDHYLPLSISPPATVTRVMVGRIELVTPSQRNLLRQLAALSPQQIKEDSVLLHRNYFDQIVQQRRDLSSSVEGQHGLTDEGVSVPASYRHYLALGRFRNALVLNEVQNRSSAGLNAFIATYRLEPYQPVATP